MELYTLSSKFLPQESVGQFTSAIWTERYFTAGDIQLVVHAVPSQIEKLAKGTMLGLRGTKEIMMIETQSVEDGLLTVTGSSLLAFLNSRQAWFWNPEYKTDEPTSPLASEYTKDNLTAGQIISDAVDKMVINPTVYVSSWAPINLDWPNEKIPGLQLGIVDGNGAPKRLSVPLGQLYDSIQHLAEEEGLGLKLYLESARYNGGVAPPDYVLKFATYRGKNRTSEQSVHTLMRLSPKLDSLTDVKEINSITNYKNVFYVVYKNIISTHYIPGLAIPTGFNRRSILVEAPDIFLEPDHIAPFREQVARNTIANHVYVQAVDGQISQQTGYTFGEDYYLGDIIELEGFTGLLSKARVTEYIRSEDQFGEKAYPTLAVLDPLFVGYIPDLEPNPDFDPGFDEDPDYDFDFDFTDENDLDDPEVTPPSKDPRDPPEHNPDPTYDFGDPGPGDGDGDGEPSVGDHGLLPLTPFESADWYYDTNLGYYVHQGRVYVVGQATAEGVDYLGSDTLLLNIPSELAPENPVSSRVLIDHQNSTIEYAFDSGLQIGPWLDVTVNPNGTVTFDDGNPYHIVSEMETSIIVLTLSGIEWPTSSAVADTYSPTGSFDDYIASQEHASQLPFLESIDNDAWSNVDGHYTVHDNIFHLDGKVKAEIYAKSVAPLILIPPIHQPKQSAESNRGSPRCEVAQKDGYKFGIDLPRQGLNRALINSQGAQNPQACGNNGRGYNATHFHSRNRDGQILRGFEVPSVNPDGYGEGGIEYVTCSGTPIPGSALEEGGWYGSTYSATFSFKKEDLHLQANPSVDANFSYVGGSEQLSFVIGYGLPGAPIPYYKMIYTIDESDNIWWQLLLNEPGQQPRVDFTMDSPFLMDNEGTYRGRFTLSISTRWQDVGFLEDPASDYPTRTKYFRITDTANRSYNILDEDIFQAPTSSIGHMCYHFPEGSSCQLISANIYGLGDFPALIEPGDVIDFTGGNWPLT